MRMSTNVLRRIKLIPPPPPFKSVSVIICLVRQAGWKFILAEEAGVKFKRTVDRSQLIVRGQLMGST